MTRFTRIHLALVSLLALVALALFWPDPAHAASGTSLPIPWLDEIIAKVLAAVVMVLQDLLKGIGIVLWSVLKLCGGVGLLGDNFSALFGDVITEAINAVIGGEIRTILRASLMLSLALVGLSLVAHKVWPNLKVVDFRRAVLWGIALQAYLLNASSIYTQLETMRVDLANEVAGAVSSGAVPGCGGDPVNIILCIAGTTPTEVVAPDLNALPNTLPPYGGSETVYRLYNHCAYNPAYTYGDPACDPDDPQGDPWEVLGYAQSALGLQFLSLILGGLILAYGVLQLALGLAAGMMFVLFPVAGIFAFYTPLESFAAGVIRNYINIFLKSIVLLTLAAVVIRLFTVASGNFLSMAAVSVLSLLLCITMAKEAMSSLIGSVGFVGSAAGSLGAGMSLSGGVGALPASAPAAGAYGGEMTRKAASLLGAPLAIASGGAAALAGAAMINQGATYGETALVGNLASTLNRSVGKGFMAGAGAASVARMLGGTQGGGGQAGAAPQGGPQPGQPLVPASALPATQPLTTTPPQTRSPLPGGARLAPPTGSAGTGTTPAWSPASARQIQATTTKLNAAPPQVQGLAQNLAATSHSLASQWLDDGQSPIQPDGHLDPAFVEAVTQHDPTTAAAFVQEQSSLPPADQVSLGEAAALGVTTERDLSSGDMSRGLARAVKNLGPSSLDSALRHELGAGAEVAFGERATRAEQVAAQMRQAGLNNEPGRQLVEAVHGDLRRDPHLTAAQFRDRRAARMRQWDQATGDPETTDRVVEGLVSLGLPQAATVHKVPRPPQAATTTPTPAPNQTSAPAAPPTPGPVAPPDPNLVQQLKTWRREAADQVQKRPFHVLTNTTLEAVAAARPRTLEELAAVKGIGPKKLEQYGQAILDITHTQEREEPHP